MKKIFFYGVGIFTLIYVLYIKLVFPVELIAYENFHGVHFLNTVFGLGCNITCYDIPAFFRDIAQNSRVDNGTFPMLLYGLIFGIFPFEYHSIFFLQGMFNILTAIIFSFLIYQLFSKNSLLAIIFFSLYITLPHQIRYGFSEDYYVLGIFLVSITALSFFYFLKHQKYIYLFTTFFFFSCALFTRNNFLSYIPLYFFIFCIFQLYHKKNIPIKIEGLILSIIPIGLTLFNRVPVFFHENTQYSTGGGRPDIGRIYASIQSLFPEFLFIGAVFFIVGSLCYLWKHKKLGLLMILFGVYVSFLVFKISSLRMSEVSLLRHLTLLAPLYIFCCSIGFLFIARMLLKLFPQKGVYGLFFIAIIFLGIQPYLYQDSIRLLTSYQREVSFIESAIGTLGNRYSLKILEKEHRFPSFLYRKIDNIDVRTSYFDSPYKYNIDAHRKNLVYIGTSCYRSETLRNGNQDDVFEQLEILPECVFDNTNFTISPVVEGHLAPTPYVFPYFPKVTDLKIGFYEISSSSSK